ncbi:MAG: hypothetical protein ABIA93_04405 [Candidatus Woesearchaeota archaeon]
MPPLEIIMDGHRLEEKFPVDVTLEIRSNPFHLSIHAPDGSVLEYGTERSLSEIKIPELFRLWGADIMVRDGVIYFRNEPIVKYFKEHGVEL